MFLSSVRYFQIDILRLALKRSLADSFFITITRWKYFFGLLNPTVIPYFPVPPAIIDARTSVDQIVKEGSPVNLTCDARGSPKPKIMWKREDGAQIRFNGELTPTVDGNSLVFGSASRAHVGEYLCIASNGVPPSISKRIVLRVQCEFTRFLNALLAF